MARNTRKYDRGEEKDQNETIQKLKSQIRHLKKQNKELRSENKTLLEAWAKTEAFLAEVTKGVPLDDLLNCDKLPEKHIKKNVRNNLPFEELTKEEQKEKTRQKWAKWKKENLDKEKK